jgi:hypothetical protein
MLGTIKKSNIKYRNPKQIQITKILILQRHVFVISILNFYIVSNFVLRI